MHGMHGMNESDCEIAAKNGHLSVLKWFHTNGFKFDDLVISTAVANGHMHILQWACKKGFKITHPIYRAAVEHNQTEILEWMRQYDPTLCHVRMQNRVSCQNHISIHIKIS
jgi:hypothetical protein